MGFGFPVTGAQGPQGAQGFQGPAGSGSTTAPNNGTNPTYVGSGQTPTSGGATAGNGQSSTATFSTDTILFVITLGTERESIICHTSYASNKISALSDTGGYFLNMDSGVGVYISKPVNSAVVTVKNRMGASDVILIQGVNTAITAATIWS